MLLVTCLITVDAEVVVHQHAWKNTLHTVVCKAFHRVPWSREKWRLTCTVWENWQRMTKSYFEKNANKTMKFFSYCRDQCWLNSLWRCEKIQYASPLFVSLSIHLSLPYSPLPLSFISPIKGLKLNLWQSSCSNPGFQDPCITLHLE